MQRIIPFGRDYAQSAEFSVDEGQTIRFWLVREDYTTTPGEHAFAELQIKSASGNDHWTTLHVMDGDKPYYDLIGVDENVIYRWVRKPNRPVIAVDRANDGAYSRTLRAPVDLRQSDFSYPTSPVVLKAQAATSGDFVGLHYDYQGDDPAAFGSVLGALPNMYVGTAPSESYIKFYRDTDTDALVVEFHEDTTGAGDGSTSIEWSEYEGGRVGIATECGGNGLGDMQWISWNITAGNITDNGLALNLPGLGIDPTLVDWIAAGKTFFVFLAKAGQANPSFNLGPRTGRFTLDRNDVPARLSASPFDTAAENVALSVVEGNTVFPMMENGNQRTLNDDNTVTPLNDPGEYEWQRSCNSSPGVWLNTGWRA